MNHDEIIRRLEILLDSKTPEEIDAVLDQGLSDKYGRFLVPAYSGEDFNFQLSCGTMSFIHQSDFGFRTPTVWVTQTTGSFVKIEKNVGCVTPQSDLEAAAQSNELALAA